MKKEIIEMVEKIEGTDELLFIHCLLQELEDNKKHSA